MDQDYFFCIASGLRCVDVGMGSVDDVIEQLAIKTVSFGSVKALAPGLFRLGRYKITASDNNLITWQAIGSNNKIISGAGCIQSGILILDSPKGELPEATRKIFYSELKSLPPWSQTPVWGHAESLKICNDQEPRKNFHVTSWIPGFTENFQGDRILSSLSKRNEKESIAEPNAPYKEHLKMKWAFLGDLAILTFKLVDSGLRRCIIIFEKVGNCFAKKWVIFSQPHPDKDSS